MRHPVPALVLVALVFCLLAVFCGCGTDSEPPESDPTAVETEAESVPERTSDRLELDRVLIGDVYSEDKTLYFRAHDLNGVWTADLTETAESDLQLCLGDAVFILRNGSEAVDTKAGPVLLDAPVRHCDSEWYLPLDALRNLWGRVCICDRADGVRRYLALQSGPAIRINGAAPVDCRMLGGAEFLPAELFASLSGGSTEASDAPDGSPVLTLRARDHVLQFREGALEAELDDNRIALPSPVWQEQGNWYLPLRVTAKALGCVAVSETAAGIRDLFLPETGRALWLNGRYLGNAYDIVGVQCAGLLTIAEALEGSFQRGRDFAILKAMGRTLCFQAGSRHMICDGKRVRLPIPALQADGAWFVPLLPLADALGLEDRTDGSGLIFSRMELRETDVRVNGVGVGAYGLPEGPLYIRLRDAAEASGGSFLADGGAAELTVWGRTAELTAGAADVRIGATELTLEAPVLADGGEWYAPAELLKETGLSELQDPELDRIYYTHIVRNDTIAVGYRIPVFMYHAVSDFIWGSAELFVSPSELEKQLQALQEGGYTPITFEDLDRIEEIEKPVMLTFDDGYDDNYTELFPLLKKYNMKATVFVITNDVGIIHKLTEAQIREMSESGLVSIQSHTMSHSFLAGLYGDYLHREHYGSMLKLARITGKQPFVLCYPTGVNSDYSRTVTAQYYEFGLCMGGPCYVTGDPPYLIYRYYVPRYLSLSTFLSYLD